MSISVADISLTKKKIKINLTFTPTQLKAGQVVLLLDQMLDFVLLVEVPSGLHGAYLATYSILPTLDCSQVDQLMGLLLKE